MSKQLTVLILILLTLFGGFLRFYKNTENPPALNIDEVSFGYSAYSILKTGRDENNVFMPVFFKSTGDYKSPVLTYSLVPAIAVFGLNEFSVRFTTALAGTLSIPVFFLLLITLLKNQKIALYGTILLTISPWHIYYSRYASESVIGIFLLLLGLWCFLKMFEGGKFWAVAASFMLALSMYSYLSPRLFIPLFLLTIFLNKARQLKAKSANVWIFIFTILILISPMVFLLIWGGANKRAGMVFLSQDIDYTRYVILDHSHRLGENFLLFFFWAKRYLNYFQPDFLFSTGLNMTMAGSGGLGVLYLFELPWLCLGFLKLAKNKFPGKSIIIYWILLGIIPATLANNELSSSRTMLVAPALITIVAIGLNYFTELITSVKKTALKISIMLIYSIFILIILLQAILVFVVHFPIQQGEAFMEGTKESVLYAINNKDQYKEIVYDPFRGIEAPNIVNIPYMYILFYSKYDPAKFQTEPKISINDSFHFDKYTIRSINWREHADRERKGTLFIGSPWSLPEKDLKDARILKKIYLSNGSLALIIVTPN